MKYFTIKELCKSSTAEQLKIDNSPTLDVITNLTALVDNILDPLRIAYRKPIIVNSGYRCEALNNAVGGSKTSQHRSGLAGDITGGNKQENKKLFDLIRKLDLPFDLLIDEGNFSWIHVSYSKKPRKLILHL